MQKFPDFVPPTKIHYPADKGPTLQIRRCTLLVLGTDPPEEKSFDKEEMLAFSHGTLLENAPEKFDVRLPIPPMLMVDRILEIRRDGSRGRIVAERDVAVDDWFFQCHFVKDPVQPGCLGVDGVWQLLGFYCAWGGGLGSGRALGCGSIEFSGQIRPHDHCVRYEIDIRRFTTIAHAGATLVIADATKIKYFSE